MELFPGIYAIVDVARKSGAGECNPASIAPERVEEVTRALLLGGARVLQLRAKDSDDRDLLVLARTMRALTSAAGAELIIDDRADIALLAEADGVHLGQTDLPVSEVRRWFPSDRIIGVSCHTPRQIEEALRDQRATYLAYGPIYRTTSKARPDPVVGVKELAEVCLRVKPLSVVAIGGITIDRLPEVRGAGARGAAMISALLSASDIAEATRAAIRAFGPEAEGTDR